MPQPEAVPPGEGGQRHDRLVGEPGIGGMGHRLGLDGGVDRHPLEVLGGQGPGLVRDAQALVEERRQPFLAEPLAPSRQRGPVEAQLVLEDVLAAEVLEVRALHPARAQRLVGE